MGTAKHLLAPHGSDLSAFFYDPASTEYYSMLYDEKLAKQIGSSFANFLYNKQPNINYQSNEPFHVSNNVNQKAFEAL